MAANTLIRAAGFTLHSNMTSAEGQALQQQSMESINRNSSKSGALNFPFVLVAGDYLDKTPVIWDPVANRLEMHDDSSGVHALFALDRLPDGHLFDSVVVKLAPDTGHAGAPGTLPRVRVLKFSIAGVCTELDSVTYAWVDVGTYEAGISITCDNFAETIDLATYRYAVEIRTEAGAGSVSPSNMGLMSMTVSCSLNKAAGGPDFTHWLKV